MGEDVQYVTDLIKPDHVQADEAPDEPVVTNPAEGGENIIAKVSDEMKKNVEKAKNLVTPTATTATDNEPAEVTEHASASEEKTIVEKVSDEVRKNVEKAKDLVTPTATTATENE